MTFEEWTDRTFGSNFQNEEMLTYFRMSATWETAQDDEREKCASLLEISNSELLLMSGEMSAQELRTVRAVLNAMANKIRSVK